MGAQPSAADLKNPGCQYLLQREYSRVVKQLRIVIAQVFSVLLFLGITLIQLFSFPGQFAHMRRVDGLSRVFEIGLTAVVFLWLLCGQIALVAIWKVVGEMKTERFFGLNSLRWIDRLILALKAACIFPLILFALLATQADDPGFFVLLSVVTLFLVTLTVVTTLLKDEIGGMANDSF